MTRALCCILLLLLVLLCSVSAGSADTGGVQKNQTAPPAVHTGSITGNTISKTTESATPVVRYTNANLTPDIRHVVDHIDIQNGSGPQKLVFVYFTNTTRSAQAGISEEISDFIIHRKEWTGNRTALSLSSGIYIPWVAENLNSTVRSTPILTKLCTKLFPEFQKRSANLMHPVILASSYSDDKKRAKTTCYPKTNLSGEIADTVDRICFQSGKQTDTQVYVYFSAHPGIASFTKASQISHFIHGRKEWTGDRSEISTTVEIYLHWLADNLWWGCQRCSVTRLLYEHYIIGTMDVRTSPIRPVDVGFYYAGLNGTPIMDPLLRLF